MVNPNKRKRVSVDQSGPNHPSASQSDFSPTQAFESQYLQHPVEHELNLAEALTQHNAGDDSHDAGASNGQSVTDTASAALHFSMNVPDSTESQFLAQAENDTGERTSEPNFDIDTTQDPQETTTTYSNYSNIEQLREGTQPQQTPAAATRSSPTLNSPPNSGNKPSVGSDEWHKVRRDNHKEVERRRRETINEGINELAGIVPGCEKNKGQILARAVQFITQLKENESQNIEKWTLEKLLTEQAIAELSSSCDKLKADLRKTRKENDAWRICAKRAGLSEPSAEDRKDAEKAERDE